METPTTAPLAVAKPMEPPSTAPQPAEAKPKKRSSVRHTRAIQRDRSKRPISAPPAEAVVARLTRSSIRRPWPKSVFFTAWGCAPAS